MSALGADVKVSRLMVDEEEEIWEAIIEAQELINDLMEILDPEPVSFEITEGVPSPFDLEWMIPEEDIPYTEILE